MNLALSASLLLAYSGMLALCLAMDRHARQLWGRPPSTMLRRILRAGGWLLLGLALVAASRGWDAGMATVAWFGLVSLAGFALLMLLPWAPRLALWLPAAGGLAWLAAVIAMG